VAVSNVELRVDGRNAVNQLNRVNKAANTLQGTVGKLAGTFAGIQAAKFVFFKTAELETQTRSLKVLTGSLGNAQKIIKELQQFGAVTPFTSTELIETAKRLKAFGFETEKIVDVTKRLGDIAGATGADLGGIATAFGQIQAKGRLQGEELLQLQERGVDLQGTLRKEYGLTADEFQKALSQGRIGADAVTFALEKLTEEGGKYAEGAFAQSDTLSGKLSTLQDNIDNLARTLGNVLSPAIKGILDQAIGSLNALNQLLAIGARAQDFGMTQQERVKILRQAEEEAKEIALIRGGGKLDPAVFNQIKMQREKDLIEMYGFETGQIQPELAVPDIARIRPELGGGRNGGRNGAAGSKRVDISRKLLDLNKQLIAAQDSQQERLAATLNLMIEKQTIQESSLEPNQKELKLLQASQTFRQEILSIDKKIADQRADDIAKAAEGFEAQMAYQDELRQAIAEQKSQYEELNTTFRNGIVDSILAAVEGTKSLKDSLLGVIRQMARLILQQQLLNALKGFNIFGGGGGVGFTSPNVLTSGLDFSGAFANGGRPAVGKAALVGERGPELFVPDRAGTIIPNNALGGSNIVVNVDASGSSVEGDAQQSKALGQALGAAVKAELIKQKMPGGLLA
jgi:tape measure domain-containing protein